MATSFADVVSPIVDRHVSEHAHHVLEQLGDDARRSLSDLERARRAAMVDRLVRNLHLSVVEAPALERELLRATGAEPTGSYEWRFDSATAIVDLRSGLHYLGVWLGYQWEHLARVQAVIGNFVRWAWANGAGTLRETVGHHSVHFSMSVMVPGYDARLVQTSPFVTSISELTHGLTVDDDHGAVRIEFDLKAP